MQKRKKEREKEKKWQNHLKPFSFYTLEDYEKKFSKFCIFYNLDEHLYAQLSKWALWLLFVKSKIKLSLVRNTRITLFDGKD